MQRARLGALGCLLVLVCATAAFAQPAGILLSPVLVDIPAARGVGQIRVENGRAAAVSFEVDAYRWTQDNGVDVLTPTRDLAVAPSVFELAPSGARIVRIAMAPSVRASTKEASFRLIVRELPPETLSSAGPTILLEMSIPVFATVGGCASALSLASAPDTQLTLVNTGCAHARLLEVGAATLPAAGVPRYLLAGAGFTRAFPEFHDALRVVTANANARTEQVLRVAAADPAGGVGQRER